MLVFSEARDSSRRSSLIGQDMTYSRILEISAHWGAILTFAVAVVGYGLYRWERWGKRRRLEKYLRGEVESDIVHTKRTPVALSAELGMTEVEVMDAAFRSSCIKRFVSSDSKGHASKVLLEYSSK